MESLLTDIEGVSDLSLYGRVQGVQGLMVEIAGAHGGLAVGSRCRLEARHGEPVPAEVVGFRNNRALALPFGQLEGVGTGCRAWVSDIEGHVRPHDGWLGRVVDAHGAPVDGKGELPLGSLRRRVRTSPPAAHARARVGEKIDLGVRALNTFVPCCIGQRMGVFAGSGVGKSVLMSMMARYTDSDITVIGLIGERGREVQEFIEDYLGPEGLARSVVVVATSDEPPLMRRQAAWLTLTVAEHFRDQGRNVLCLLDSVTRFAMAQREIGLACGEPPATRGYTPSVFAELPRLLERAGPGTGAGSITGLFTVLVEGDDHNEPVADAVRGILDGHVVLTRAIAERGRYPAIDVLRSVSRLLPDCHSEQQNLLMNTARRALATYDDMEDLVRVGAYRAGSDPAVDAAIALREPLEAFLSQNKDERADMAGGFAALAALLGVDEQTMSGEIAA